MKLFGQIIRTAVNLVETPIPVVKDLLTMGGIATGRGPYTLEHLQKIKDDASET